MRAITRLTGVSINTVSKLLMDAGEACAGYHDEHVRGVESARAQCDEIWSSSMRRRRTSPRRRPLPRGPGCVDVDGSGCGLQADPLVGGRGSEQHDGPLSDGRHSGTAGPPGPAHHGWPPGLSGGRRGSLRSGDQLRDASEALGKGREGTSRKFATARLSASGRGSRSFRGTLIRRRSARPTSSGRTSRCGWGCGGSPG